MDNAKGDSLSPFLFNLSMDKIIEEVSSLNMGNRMGQNKRIDLQRQLHKFYQINQMMNMTISTEKTKSIM